MLNASQRNLVGVGTDMFARGVQRGSNEIIPRYVKLTFTFARELRCIHIINDIP